MALFLDEVWIKDPDPEKFKAFVRLISQFAEDPASIGAPQIRLIAGPWASNEEPKVLFIVDIPNHSPTYQDFGPAMARGLVARRRLTPIVEWKEVERMVARL
jgi:hypothetical protein